MLLPPPPPPPSPPARSATNAQLVAFQTWQSTYPDYVSNLLPYKVSLPSGVASDYWNTPSPYVTS